jgi:hypothetical protein
MENIMSQNIFSKKERKQNAYEHYVEFLSKYPSISKRDIAELCCETWEIQIHELADVVAEAKLSCK